MFLAKDLRDFSIFSEEPEFLESKHIICEELEGCGPKNSKQWKMRLEDHVHSKGKIGASGVVCV